MALDIMTLGASKEYANMVALGISNMRVEGTTVYFTIAESGQEVSVTLPTPADGKDGKDGKDGTNGTNGVDGKDGKDGADGEDGVGIANISIDENNDMTVTYTDGSSQVLHITVPGGGGGGGSSVYYDVELENGELVITKMNGTDTAPTKKDYRWKYVPGTVTTKSVFNYNSRTVESASDQYAVLYYVFNGEKRIRFSGATTGSSNKLAYAFVSQDGNIVKVPSYVKGEVFEDVELDVPDGSYAIYINGNNYMSAHLEVAAEDLQANLKTLQPLLSNYAKKISYRDTFAWKPMPTGYVAFTFDDSLDDVADVVDLFISKNVPCCFGAIPEKMNMGLSNGETVAEAMMRGVNAVGCEVLAHGFSGTEIVTANNIDDLNFLYNKFVVNKQKLIDFGFNVRGCVRVGGSGNICNDPRTDVWVRLFFDYCDLYGIAEPYNHPRISINTGLEGYKAAIDDAITNRTFAPILFHQCPDYIGDLIDYAINQGAVVCNYATVYDTFGSTTEQVGILNRLAALENSNGNEVSY